VGGLELLRRLRSDKRTETVPVVILSIEDSPDSLDDYGANGFIRKPVTSAKLAESARQMGFHWLVTDEASSANKEPRVVEPPRATLSVLLVETRRTTPSSS
jgi:CheY-like chemotaxis protein